MCRLRAMNPAPPRAGCQSCGVCCFSFLPTYVRLTGDDWTRLGAGVEKFAHFIGHRAYMKMTEGHCRALVVRRSVAGALEYRCTVYGERPQVCRDLARGSPECLGELATKGARAGLMT